MRRIYELIAEIRSRYPKDHFFSDFEQSCTISTTKKAHFQAYDRALMTLDTFSWNLLKHKSLQHYLDHRKGQRKQGFFNQLNEAFAYRYLVGKGFDDVRFIPEDKKRRPDIGFTCNGSAMYCEVKSLGISDDEISRRNTNIAYKGDVYASLGDGFLKKIRDAVNTANQQIKALGSEGLVYVVIKFDDIALDNYRIYRRQLVEISANLGFKNLFIKIGVLGNKRICITNGSTRMASSSASGHR